MPKPSPANERAALDPALNRRSFLGAAGLAAAAAAAGAPGRFALAQNAAPDEPPVPPGIDPSTIAEAQKLIGLEFTPAERAMIAPGIPDLLELYERLRDARIENHEAPAEVFNPRLPGVAHPMERRPARWREPTVEPLPNDEQDIAFAPAWKLSHWIRTRQLTSERLTRLYIDRLERFGPALECVVTLMKVEALERARQMDRETAAGRRRGPLHGLPWGAKDLLDTSGVRTTWGAMPYKDRVPQSDAAVVSRLNAAGAVLVAKLTLGALAYGDVWFGGRTRNPFNTEQGSSGSSAGSAAATAAGLVAFSLGTETYGSIGSPSARCGATGFRPTFGRVSRAGAMALCWSLDKVGPICRTAEDCAMVLDAINGADPDDPASFDAPLNIDMSGDIRGLRIGVIESSYEGRGVTDSDHAVLDALNRLGAELKPVEVADFPYGSLIFTIISVEAAAAFDELTRSNLDDTMQWQDARAWPNTFRTTRFVPAVECLQASRMRRRIMRQAADLFADVDVIVASRAHGAMHALTNLTGHPAITLRAGFRDPDPPAAASDQAAAGDPTPAQAKRTPRAVTLWGRVLADATLLRAGAALERELGVWTERPEIS